MYRPVKPWYGQIDCTKHSTNIKNLNIQYECTRKQYNEDILEKINTDQADYKKIIINLR